MPRLPLAALIVGCMAPDFEYLIRLAPRGRTWHTPVGLVSLAVPAGILVWIVWSGLVRPAVRRFLPPRLQPVLPASDWSPPSLLAGTAAVALGACSHVVWDAFTHADGWVVARWAVFTASIALGPLSVPLYKVLQHGSTILGALFLAGWAAGWWRRRRPDERAFAAGQLREVATVACGLIVVGALGGIINALRAPPTLPQRLGYAAVGVMLAAGLATMMWAAVIMTLPARRDRAVE